MLSLALNKIAKRLAVVMHDFDEHTWDSRLIKFSLWPQRWQDSWFLRCSLFLFPPKYEVSIEVVNTIGNVSGLLALDSTTQASDFLNSGELEAEPATYLALVTWLTVTLSWYGQLDRVWNYIFMFIRRYLFIKLFCPMLYPQPNFAKILKTCKTSNFEPPKANGKGLPFLANMSLE